MNSIRDREGVRGDDEWPEDRPVPADYSTLSEQFGKITEGAHDAVFAFVLERYGFKEVLRLYEHRSGEFDILREIGSEVTWGHKQDAAVRALTFECHLRSFGPEGSARIQGGPGKSGHTFVSAGAVDETRD